MMKKRVELSAYCLIISILTVVIICGVFLATVKSDNHLAAYICGAAVVVLLFSALCYMPLSISLGNGSLKIRRPLKTKSIALTDIADVRLCPPTMGAKRICGSGGWFGWYGWFNEQDLGKYFAYYGKASDCFLVTLKDGKKYMLGCKDAPEMVEAISKRISDLS